MGETELYLIRFSTGGGITWLDFALLFLCPIGAMLGTRVSTELDLKAELKENPGIETKEFFENFQISNSSNVMIGAALGLVLALYFVGAITQDLTSVARVVGLSILLGYQAPNIWNAQEKVISNIVNRKLQVLLEQATNSTVGNSTSEKSDDTKANNTIQPTANAPAD